MRRREKRDTEGAKARETKREVDRGEKGQRVGKRAARWRGIKGERDREAGGRKREVKKG